MDLFSQLMLNGIIIGSIYAIASLGYALTLSIGVNNFAHGATVMCGAFLFYVFAVQLHIPYLVSIPLVWIMAAGMGGALYYTSIKPFRDSSSWSITLASTLAVALILENLVMIFHGSTLFSIRNSSTLPHVLRFGNIAITTVQVALVITSLGILVALRGAIRWTPWGKQYLAVADDRIAAEALGINTESIVLKGLVLSNIIAMSAGVLIAFDIDLDASVGTGILIKAYAATVIGGIRKPGGVVAAAYLLGIIENMVAGFISTEYRLAAVFIVLIAFLLFRKEGFTSLGLRREV